ncbi:MAG: peptidylprolyl isomerase [Candidatus Thiodiazotropha taylori]|uniref:peptidylprolyl isomerase n=1 Tax=Candidatus Thiodiazotropha taylori TaxID=2792791 RepID=A0A9E4N7U0_9GAMM|nr:peptidylprolyl isomerase [Candidatus Thiodiazotropha taylori]MCW4259185.1 peptidylprolyl isomerase [Candidatus Thiodiazotropha taylori]
MDIVKIDGQSLSSDDFVIWLKLSGRFNQVIEDYIKEKMAACAARKSGMQASADELQAAADESRRAFGLHRASDTNEFLDDAGATLDVFEAFLEDNLLARKMRDQVQSTDSVESYFTLNSPKYDSVEVSHLVVEGEPQANEIVSLLKDGDETFDNLAREYSVADSAQQGGAIGMVYRGELDAELEAQIFNAEIGEPLGPFEASMEGHFEIFLVTRKEPAELSDLIRDLIQKQLYEQWIQDQAAVLQVQV